MGLQTLSKTLCERPLPGSPKVSFTAQGRVEWSWFFFYFCLSGHETSWDLSAFAAVLAPGHTSAPEPKNKKKLQGTKNNCACVQLGQIMDNNIRKTNPHPPAPRHCQTTTFEELGAKAGCNCPLHTPPPKGWVNQLSHLSRLTLGLSPYPHLMWGPC